MPKPTSTAWVESPLQMLGVMEAHASGFLGSTTRVVPRAGVPGLATTIARLRELDTPPGVRFDEPRKGVSVPRGDRIWVIGDPLSGRVQRQLVAGTAGPIVLVDDGRATLHTLARLAAGEPLTRAKTEASLPRRVLGAVAGDVLREAAARGRLTVFSVYDVPGTTRARLAGMGVRFARHRFGWLRDSGADRSASAVPAQAGGRHVVLGSALVVDGLVDPRRYLSWVRAMAGSSRGVCTYWAHRREDHTTLAGVEKVSDLEIRREGMPVELGLSGLGPGDRVSTLPTSALASLAELYAGRGVRLDDYPVPPGWWNASASPELRVHLDVAAMRPPSRLFDPTVLAA